MALISGKARAAHLRFLIPLINRTRSHQSEPSVGPTRQDRYGRYTRASIRPLSAATKSTSITQQASSGKQKRQTRPSFRLSPEPPGHTTHYTPDVVLADVEPVAAVEILVGKAEADYHLPASLKPRHALRRTSAGRLLHLHLDGLPCIALWIWAARIRLGGVGGREGLELWKVEGDKSYNSRRASGPHASRVHVCVYLKREVIGAECRCGQFPRGGGSTCSFALRLARRNSACVRVTVPGRPAKTPLPVRSTSREMEIAGGVDDVHTSREEWIFHTVLKQ